MLKAAMLLRAKTWIYSNLALTIAYVPDLNDPPDFIQLVQLL